MSGSSAALPKMPAGAKVLAGIWPPLVTFSTRETRSMAAEKALRTRTSSKGGLLLVKP